MSDGAAARMPREARRRQLIDLGVRLTAASSFEDVSLDDVATAANISRSLLFHYFPTKRDFQVAVASAAAEDLLAFTEPDRDLPVDERLVDSLERFVDYITQRREAFLSLVRGATGGETALQSVFDRAHEVVARRVLVGLGVQENDPALYVAIRGWVACVEETVVVWLEQGGLGRDDLIALLRATLVAAVDAVAADARGWPAD